MKINYKIIYALLTVCFASQYSVGQTYCDANSLDDSMLPPEYKIAITNVSFGDLDNSSDQSTPVSGGYEDYTGLTPIADFEQGTTYTIDVSVFNGPGELGVDAFVWVFIDWNQDGDFDDVDEAIGLGPTGTSSQTPSLSYDITIPANADLGNTRMRVVLISTNATFNGPPCNSELSGQLGEVEDYTINITAAPEPELLITEIAYPIIPGGEGKFVEIFNAGVTEINFGTTDFYIKAEYNAGAQTYSLQLLGKIPPKGYFIIARSLNEYNSYYSVPANQFSQFVVQGNGNDSYFLSRDNVTLYDIYGELGVDGFGEQWDYTASRAYRKNPSVKQPNTVWTEDEWEVQSIQPNNNTSIMTPGYGDYDYIYVDDTDEWDNIGLGNPNDTTPTIAQNIFVRAGTVTLTQDTNIGDLVVRSGATLELEPGVKLTVDGDIVNQGTIIFQSDANGSAVLEAVEPTTRVVGNGFEIHRYIPPQRAFRYLSPSVTTTESINENWQEGQSNSGIDYPGDNSNTVAGFGTHITGWKPSSPLPQNGFDATETGNPSMFTWNVSGVGNWQPIPNTNEDNLVLGKAYAILIRGDRSISLDDNDNVGGATRLRSTGELHVGDFPVTDLATTNGHFNLIGNPYQSQVDMKELLSPPNAENLNTNTVYIYDPTLGDRGAYATVDLASETTPTPVPEDSDANRYLQPNQAFFVQSTGGSPSLTFTEATKDNTENQTTTFSTETPQVNYINLTLKDEEDKVRDGVRVVFDEAYAAGIDYFDAVKVWNFDESLTVYSHQTELSIEKRPLPAVADTTQLHLYNYTKSNYTFQLEWVATTNPNQQVFLVDQYLNTQVELVQNQVNFYHYTVENAIPASKATNRFFLTYEVNPLSISNFEEDLLVVYPNPITNSEVYIQLPTKNDIVSKLQITIFDLLGNQIMSQEMQNTAQPILLNTGMLSSGMYMLQVKDGQNTHTKKLIVQE